jgi:hypothetical protein
LTVSAGIAPNAADVKAPRLPPKEMCPLFEVDAFLEAARESIHRFEAL